MKTEGGGEGAKICAKGKSRQRHKTDNTTTNKQDPQDTPAGPADSYPIQTIIGCDFLGKPYLT